MLGNDEIRIWHGSVDADAEANPAYWQLLDIAERTQAEKFKTPRLRQRYVHIHGCIRQLLASILKVSPQTLRIARTGHGKPYLVDYPDLAFNLSHSGDSFVLAVAWCCQLGIDIEFHQPRVNVQGLVDRCFGEAEIGYWQTLSDADKTPAFYRFWTRKEAFVKATGLGITLGLNRCIINPQLPSGFLSVPEICGVASAWRIYDLDVGQGACAALVVDKAHAVIRWHTLPKPDKTKR